MGPDGKTAYRRLKGKNFKQQYVKIGEAIWFLKPRTKGKNKGESRWGEGICLGIREESGEYIIGTQKGVIEVRTVRRRGSHEERWKFQDFIEMKGTPWEPIPGKRSDEIQIRIQDRNQSTRVP